MCCVCVPSWYVVMARRIHIIFVASHKHTHRPVPAVHEHESTTHHPCGLFISILLPFFRSLFAVTGAACNWMLWWIDLVLYGIQDLKMLFLCIVDSAVALHVLVLIFNVRTRACMTVGECWMVYGMKQQFEIVIDIQFDSSINKYQHADCYLILLACGGAQSGARREIESVCNRKMNATAAKSIMVMHYAYDG